MATINKKPTKAHKSKKVVKAHQGMAHIPRQRPIGGPSPKRRPTDPQAIPKFAREPVGRARDLLKAKTRGPIAPRPQAPTIQQPKPVRQPAVIKPARPTPIQSDASVGRGPIGQIGPRKLTSREKRRRDNAVKSELDELSRQFSKRRRRRLPIRQPRVAMPYNPVVDDFGIGRPNVVQPYKPNPLVDNIVNVSPRFNSSTALTDRFTKQNIAAVDRFNKQNTASMDRFNKQNIAAVDRFNKPIDRGPMPNARTQRRNKGGDVKKYAVGGLNKGMTKSRTRYGTVDNKKK